MELARRVNDDGQFCQQISTTEEEACDNVVLIKDKDNSFDILPSVNEEDSYGVQAKA